MTKKAIAGVNVKGIYVVEQDAPDTTLLTVDFEGGTMTFRIKRAVAAKLLSDLGDELRV